MSRTWFHGVYLQDDWKATRKLTLNLGIRWEVQRPVTDRYNRQASFDYNAVNPISAAVGQNYTRRTRICQSPADRGQYNTDYKNFAPRIGFAYQMMPKLVMRGGYGIFYPTSIAELAPRRDSAPIPLMLLRIDGGLTPAGYLEHRVFRWAGAGQRKFTGRLDQCGIQHQRGLTRPQDLL